MLTNCLAACTHPSSAVSQLFESQVQKIAIFTYRRPHSCFPCLLASCDSCRRRSFVRPSSVVRLIFIVISRKLSKTDLVTEEQVGIADSVVAFRCCHRRHLVHEIFSFSILYLARRVIFLLTYLLAIRGGSTLRPGGGTGPQMLASPPPIFWFQQQKYTLGYFVQWRNQHSYQLVHKQ